MLNLINQRLKCEIVGNLRPLDISINLTDENWNLENWMGTRYPVHGWQDGCNVPSPGWVINNFLFKIIFIKIQCNFCQKKNQCNNN